jgi:hypothetical protein
MARGNVPLGMDYARERARRGVLLGALVPRGLCRVHSAAYVGVSPSLFDQLVRDGRMPNPKLINSRTVWDRLMLDAAFDALPDKEGGPSENEWDGAEL